MENEKTGRQTPLVKMKTENRRFSFTAKQLVIAGAVVIGIMGLLLIWKIIQTNSLQKDFEKQQTALQDAAGKQLLENSQRQLRLLAKPYTWAVRYALLQSDKTKLNEYAADIVKEKNVVSVMVVDAKNTVISSSDKKWEGKDYLSFGTPYYLNVDSAVVNKLSDTVLVLASPVMGFNNKLGTVVLQYAVPRPVFPAK